MFNAKKSLLIIYKCTWRKPPDSNIYVNNVKVPFSVKIYSNSMHQNVLLILTTNLICTLLILNMLTLILEMYCSINTAPHSMAVKFTQCCMDDIYIAWRVATCYMQSVDYSLKITSTFS